MIGKQATLRDIVLEELVQPIDLHCHEELTEEVEEAVVEEEPEYTPYKIIVVCGGCETQLKLYVLATDFGIRSFQASLLENVKLVCPACREDIRNGRR
ncbi:transforming protein E7 [Human papillomavirus 23]|uniref:Protein E7 n=1 Tax=Human papillomavirus 23 TaxID=37955 RepID=VE7_HPV23|nr:RecName: Full=Protein E7 [Human papillomavirus 23]AAA79409.1 transforming protein E7 [Human papillomavirus 23]